jgi:hypothetical protein
MNCAELQRDLPDILEGDSTAAQQDHLKTCSLCSELVSELNLISQQARLLRASDEPSPRVWNSIELALRQEGLIRQPGRGPVLVEGFFRRWSPAWLLPLAAALLLSFGLLRYQRGVVQQVARQATPAPGVAATSAPTAPAIAAPAMAVDDDQLLQVVSSRSPAMRASYEADLQNVNAYIRDAEESARSHPNEEEAQRYLIDAYDQKAMVYELALDRSLP